MILVTGGTGFFGSHLLHKLVAENQPVKALCRNNSNFDLIKTIQHKIEWCNADVLDISALQDAMQLP
jgi:nucleoside-diphosphate-sugar epimerase